MKEQNNDHTQDKFQENEETKQRVQIHLTELFNFHTRQLEINSLKLESIDFLDDSSKKIEIDQQIIKDFKFTNLTIVEFIVTGFYKTGFDNKYL